MSKKTMVVIILLGIVCYFVLSIFLNSPIYLDWKLDRLCGEMHQYAQEHLPEFQVMADQLVMAQRDQEDSLWCNKTQGNLPEDVAQQWRLFSNNSPLKLDTVKINNSPLYPDGACIFSREIWYNAYGMQGKSIYAWVALVYSPDSNAEDPSWFRRTTIPVNEKWFVAVVYGY